MYKKNVDNIGSFPHFHKVMHNSASSYDRITTHRQCQRPLTNDEDISILEIFQPSAARMDFFVWQKLSLPLLQNTYKKTFAALGN